MHGHRRSPRAEATSPRATMGDMTPPESQGRLTGMAAPETNAPAAAPRQEGWHFA